MKLGERIQGLKGSVYALRQIKWLLLEASSFPGCFAPHICESEKYLNALEEQTLQILKGIPEAKDTYDELMKDPPNVKSAQEETQN